MYFISTIDLAHTRPWIEIGVFTLYTYMILNTS